MQKLIRELGLSLDGNPIYYRTNTDDLLFVSDVLVKKEYGCDGLDFGNPQVIVDCGAYAGYTSLYYLTTYQNARVIAIEPDKNNFELCRLNLAPYGDRVTLLNAAVWPESVPLVVRENPTSASEWARIVRPPVSGEPQDVMGVELSAFAREAGFQYIDLLNMNTGLEREIFSRNTAWIAATRNIVGRLTDKAGEDAFYDAMSEFQFFLTRCPAALACTAVRARAVPKPARHRNAGLSTFMIANGDFEELRVASAQSIPGGWIEGSRDPALGWQTVVCAPQFHVSLAVRTGLQRSAENALYVGMNPAQPIPPSPAPYAAIENQTPVPVSEGDSWLVNAFIKTIEDAVPPANLLRGAYIFLRLYYDDGSSQDLPTAPISHITGDYTEAGGVVAIPNSPQGRRIERATLWLYVWVENTGPGDLILSADLPWGVFFDDVTCTKL
jgi:FkbM family methyltransferase